MFRTVPQSIIRSFSLYTQQWYMSYRFVDSLQAGSGRNSVLSWSCSQIRGKGFVTWRSLVENAIKESGYEVRNKDETEVTKLPYVLSNWRTWYYSSGLRFSTPDAKKSEGNVWEYSSKKWVLLLLQERCDVISHTVWKGLFEEPLCQYIGLT